MQTTRYSPSVLSFFPFDIDYPSLPDDLIEIDITTYNKAMSRESDESFSIESDGTITVFKKPASPLAEIQASALAEIRAQRTPIITTLDGIAGRTARAGDAITSKAADEAINALLDITTLPALLAATTYDDMKAAVLARYREIVAAAPAEVKTAFVA